MPAPHPFYNSTAWTHLRARYLRAYPTCTVCGSKANQVDHLMPYRHHPELGLHWGNLQALCWSCHSIRTATLHTPQNNKARLASCDVHGQPLEPDHPWNRR